MEYFCHYCREWYDTVYCQTHFESCHGQKDVTFEKLQERLSCLGGLSVRDEQQVREANKEENQKIFLTNNFQHVL